MEFLRHFRYVIIVLFGGIIMIGCSGKQVTDITFVPMNERQITSSAKTHALDNNDNFSPDGRFLCYDTRATVFNTDLANCKTIEKVEISTGKETILWDPPFITGEELRPG